MNSAKPPAYIIENLTKVYKTRTVLDVNYLEVRAGEILAIVGPSGSGKSTLLRLLNFLEPPSSGQITYGQEVFGPERSVSLAARRSVTTVSQRPILLDRSVRANVEFGLRLRGQRDRDGQVRDALQRVGLAALEGQHARTLSGGEAQRVALARALVVHPGALLLDEPTANLDPYNVGVIEESIRALNSERGTTMVLVTHNIFQARRLADRVALILDGKIVEQAETEAFFEKPADSRSKAFIRGEMVY
ncbi:MAG: phosphate ABC transporter ATP-binding protein [Anaerolineae bacterium]|jgi:tungstate transport system ATP-binding protein|nr:phosphate ABC transporter ATP-binding protein [Anaerolineae bacterium]